MNTLRYATSHLRKTSFTTAAIFALALFSALPAFCVGPSQTTTYAALTAKNTSAGLNTNTSTEGTPSENVSKISLASVLPTGSTPHIYARFLTWFGTADHEDVGYSSADPVQVQKQVADMVSRGIDGVIVNWQGATDVTNQAATLVMSESDARNAFAFSIEIDARSLAACAATSGCDLTRQVLDELTYVQTTYSSAKSYMKFDSRPVIFLYGMEAYNIDWDKVRASLTSNPVLIFNAAPASTTALLNSFFPGSIVEPSVLSIYSSTSTRSDSISGVDNA